MCLSLCFVRLLRGNLRSFPCPLTTAGLLIPLRFPLPPFSSSYTTSVQKKKKARPSLFKMLSKGAGTCTSVAPSAPSSLHVQPAEAS